MNKLNSIILFFVFLLASSGAVASSGANSKAFEYLLNQYEEVELIRLRSLDSYKRIHKICSTPLEFSKLQYAYSSASQVMSLATGSELELRHISKSKKVISRLLYKDLESEGFHQALRDCRYTLRQTKTLIVSLLILDSSGKLLGTAGVISSFRLAKKLLGAIKKKSLKVYYGVLASGIVGSVYEIFNKFRTDTVGVTDSADIEISSIADLENLYDDDSESDDLEEFSMQIIKQLESKISNLEGVLDSSEIEGKERDSIIKEIERINLKIDAIKLV